MPKWWEEKALTHHNWDSSLLSFTEYNWKCWVIIGVDLLRSIHSKGRWGAPRHKVQGTFPVDLKTKFSLCSLVTTSITLIYFYLYVFFCLPSGPTLFPTASNTELAGFAEYDSPSAPTPSCLLLLGNISTELHLNRSINNRAPSVKTYTLHSGCVYVILLLYLL